MTSKDKKTKFNFANSKINVSNKSSSIKKPIKITCIYAKKINNQKQKKQISIKTNKSLKKKKIHYKQKQNNITN